MYNLAMFSQHINEHNAIYKLYVLAINEGIIHKPKIFSDQNTIIDSLPSLHTYYLMSQNYLVLTDNSVFNMIDGYKSNKFICIDVPSRLSSDYVDFYSIEDFHHNKNYIETLKQILNKPEYANYVVQ